MGRGQQRRAGLITLIGLGLLAALVFLLWGLRALLPDLDKYKDIADLVQTVITILALMGGGAFAAYKLELFRDFEPHLTISHTINHRNLGNGYIHLDVKSTLRNNSKVRLELNGGYFLLQQIRPIREGDDPLEPNVVYPDLPTLDEASFDLGDQTVGLEPGQSLQEVLQFLVPDDVESLLVHYSFYDSMDSSGSQPGWGITEVYDMMV